MMLETSESITGSWYPSGFHGHFRSKTRNDFEIPYRHHARPIPPQKFMSRAQVRSDKHLFSRHDNRNNHSSGMGDLETHFTMGLGKRKPVSTTSQHHKNTVTLLHWDIKDKRNDVSSTINQFQSSYKNSFRPSLVVQTRNSSTSATSTNQINETSSTMCYHCEPIHSRRNPELQRRLLTARPVSLKRSPPLLAWGPNTYESNTNDIKNYKPCVGDTSQRTITRVSYGPVKTSTLITERL